MAELLDERLLLRELIACPTRIDEVYEHFRPRHLSGELHPRLYEIIKVLAGKEQYHDAPIDPHYLALLAKDGNGVVEAICELKAPDSRVHSLESLSEGIVSRAFLRETRRLAGRLGEFADKSDDTPEMRMDALHSEVSGVLKTFMDGTRRAVSSTAPFPDAVERYRDWLAGDPREGALRTGLPMLDRQISPLAPGRYVLLAARPGLGKTSLALNVSAVALRDGHRVLFVSLEMSEQELIGRLASSESGVSELSMVSRQAEQSEEEAYQAGLDRVEAWNCVLVDQGVRNDEELIATASRAHTDAPLSLVVVDYLQLLGAAGEAARQNRNAQMEVISRGMKRLAKELEVPVLALSQLSRKVEGRNFPRPVLGDLRDSGSLEQDADVVMFLYRERDAEDGIGADCAVHTVTHLEVAKNRHGPRGVTQLLFDAPRYRFTPFDPSRNAIPRAPEEAG